MRLAIKQYYDNCHTDVDTLMFLAFKRIIVFLSVLESAHPLQTCPEPELPVDTYTYQLVGTVQTGTYAYLTCEQDYELTSTGHKKVYCGKNGRWNRGKDELASCKGLYPITRKFMNKDAFHSTHTAFSKSLWEI